jgi:Chitinase class I
MAPFWIAREVNFKKMFSKRNSFYTYSGLTSTLSAYPVFATTGSDTVNKWEAAAFLANVSNEAGGLVYIVSISSNRTRHGKGPMFRSRMVRGTALTGTVVMVLPTVTALSTVAANEGYPLRGVGQRSAGEHGHRLSA